MRRDENFVMSAEYINHDCNTSMKVVCMSFQGVQMHDLGVVAKLLRVFVADRTGIIFDT